MAKEEFYKHCTLAQGNDDVNIRIVTWIPEEGAEIGKSMRLKDPISKKWKEGRWTVTSVGDSRKSGAEVRKRIAAARKYIKATDI